MSRTKEIHNLNSASSSPSELDVLSFDLNLKSPLKKMIRLQARRQFENMCDQLIDITPTSSDNEDWFRAKFGRTDKTVALPNFRTP